MFLSLLLGVGCVGSSHSVDDTATDTFAYGHFGSYDAGFEAATWSYLPGGGGGGASDFNLSISGGDGLTDCGLAGDFDARPVYPAEQIFVSFWDSDYQDCPEGLYTIGACDHDNQDALGSECGRFRQWDADGAPLADLNASSGAVRVTDQGAACRFEVELGFPEGTFEGTASIAYDGSEAGPFCDQ